MPRNHRRDRAPLTVLLCAGLLLALAGPQPPRIARPQRAQAGGRAPVGGLVPMHGPAPAGDVLAPAGDVLVPAGEVPAAGGYRWPLDGDPRVVRRFDPPPRPWLPGHRGVDLAGTPAATVRAAGAGRVRFAGRVAGRPVVSVDHPGGLRTTYEPVEPLVRTGDDVSAGEPIGRLAAGHSGCTAAACLHWGLRRGDSYLDPLSLLGLGRVRLLPLAGPA